MDVDGVPAFVDDLISGFADGLIRDAVRNVLVDFPEAGLDPVLSDVLAGLSIPTTGIAVPRFGATPIR